MDIVDTNKISPVFITGTYRSGTTLLVRLLDNHPELSIWADAVHFFRYCFKKYEPFSDYGNAFKLVSDVAGRLHNRFGMDVDADDIHGSIDKNNITYASVYNAIYSSSFFLQGKKRWGEKTVLAWTSVEDFIEMFPLGKVVILIRDPRAVLVSWKKETFAKKPLYLDAIFNCLGIMQHSGKLKNKLGNDRVIVLQFESLIKNTEHVLDELCDFLNVKYSGLLLDTSKFNDSKDDKHRTNLAFPERNKNDSGIKTGPINDWHNLIEKDELLICNRIAADELDAFNYYDLRDEVGNDSWLKKVFDNMPEYLRQNYLKWKNCGVGHEGYPLDPTKSENWDPKTCKNFVE